jgi:hypothetical protein
MAGIQVALRARAAAVRSEKENPVLLPNDIAAIGRYAKNSREAEVRV